MTKLLNENFEIILNSLTVLHCTGNISLQCSYIIIYSLYSFGFPMPLTNLRT